MSDFLDFVKAWAKLISGVFADFTLAASIVTLIAAVLFFAYEHQKKTSDWTTRSLHFFIALVGWAVAVPILGMLFKVVASIWGIGEGMFSALKSLGSLVYSAYEKHPLVVLTLLLINLVVFLVWHLIRPRHPSQALKGIACFSIFSLSVAIASPIANLFSETPDIKPKTKPLELPVTSGSASNTRSPQVSKKSLETKAATSQPPASVAAASGVTASVALP